MTRIGSIGRGHGFEIRASRFSNLRGSRSFAPFAAGKHADLVVIKGDPSKKIEDIENVETVFKDGVGYDSEKLIEAVRRVVGSR